MRVGEAEEEEEEEDAQSISAIRAMAKRETHKKTNLVIAVLEEVVVVLCLAVATADEDEDEDEGDLPMVTSAGHQLVNTIIMHPNPREREERCWEEAPQPLRCNPPAASRSVLNEREGEGGTT